MSVLAALLLAAAPLAPVDTRAIDAVVARIFGRFNRDNDATAAWELPVWSAQTAALIRHWQRVMPEGELDGLNDAEWFCGCQDWDSKAFRATTVSRTVVATGVVHVRLKLALGGGTVRVERLVLRKEKGVWRVDDLFAEGFETGLKAALRQTIAEDAALAREARK